MTEKDRIHQMRRSLSSMRLRFAPEIQPIKEFAFDEIVQNVMFYHGNSEWVTLEQLTKWLGDDCAIRVFDADQIIQTIDRLRSGGIIEIQVRGKTPFHKLSQETVDSIQKVHLQAERQLSEVVELLFRDAPGGAGLYKEAFIDCVCFVFAELAEESAQLVSGKVLGSDVANSDLISKSIATVHLRYAKVKSEILNAGLGHFFKENDPRFTSLQFELAQNYFIVKSFGADPAGSILSSDLFSAATFYLDTNVIIGAIAPTQGRQKSILTLKDVLRRLKSDFVICQITKEEMRNVQLRSREDSEQLRDKVPSKLSRKTGLIRGDENKEDITYYEIPLSQDDVFLTNDTLPETCRDIFDSEDLDDVWFDENKGGLTIKQFSNDLRRRAPYKGESATLHDALLLTWVANERERLGRKDIYVLTTDRSLPSLSPPGFSPEPVAITATALFQWASPIIGANPSGSFADAFAELFRSHVLPRRPMLRLSDFRVFYELHIESQFLPEEDVEGCIRYLRANASNLDPRNPKDLLLLAREVANYFADPGRKHNKEIENLRKDMDAFVSKHEVEKERIHSQYQAKLQLAEDEKRTMGEGHKQELKRLGEQYKEVKNTLDDVLKQNETARMKRSGAIRLVVSILITLLALVAAGAATSYWGNGSYFERIRDAWEMIAAAGGVVFAICMWLVVGKKRLKYLGLPLGIFE